MKKFNLFIQRNSIQFPQFSGFNILSLSIFTASFLTCNCINAQALTPPKTYVCYQPQETIQIDGKLEESSWRKAAWTDQFVDIEGARKPMPLQKTRIKMLWDKEFLYIAAVIEEEHIWAYQDKKDQIVYLENDFEVFIDPDGDTNNYYELEINALNNSFDLFLPKPYRHGGQPDLKWNITNLRSAVSIDGTINNSTDKDKKWILEIAIPFSSLSTTTVAAILPKADDTWRINFSRVNWQFEVDKAGKYARKKNPETGKMVPEYNWVWSPQGAINMHLPEYWGFLKFSDSKVKKGRKD